MFRLVSLVLLGACGFHIGGTAAIDGGNVDDATDANLDDALVDDMPVDGNRPGWWNASWQHRRLITLDTSSLIGPVTDFPVLVRLPALTGTLPNGGDLRFVSLDGSVTYPYEIEAFNAAGTTPVWIRMTLSSASDTELWVYYGNSNAPTASNGAAVFASNHVSVHHLGSLVDATGHGHAATNGNLNAIPSISNTGRIGAARTFDGNDDFLVLTSSNGPYDFTTTMYASVWVRVEGFEDAYQAIITKGDTSWRLARAQTSNAASFGWNGAGNDLFGSMSIAGGEWHHVAIVQTQTAKYLYVDGVEDEASQSNSQLDNNEYSVRFGANEQSTFARYWHGDLDEVRISSLARDAAWISAEFKTADASFATVGADEPY